MYNSIKLSFFLLLATSAIQAQVLKYENGNGNWDEDSLGNHRVIVSYTGNGNIARVLIPWRRIDDNPGQKRIIVQDAKSGKKILNTFSRSITAEKGDILFEPISGAGNYYIYYLPSKNEGRANYPKGVYLQPEATADQNWLSAIVKNQAINAKATTIQSIDAFNTFYPMEVAATFAETQKLIARSARKDMLVFTEDRMNPIKMKSILPYHWTNRSARATFAGQAARGEQYSFQIGIYALQDLENLSVSFSALSGTNSSHQIAAANISCINTTGRDYKGQSFQKQLAVPAKEIQALWCLVNIPAGQTPGKYTGNATVTARGKIPFNIPISITISNNFLADGGINEPWKQTRLHWLNSTLYQENNVIAPYTALQVKNNSISLLGRKVQLNQDGFPEKIETFFTPEMTGYTNSPTQLIGKPIGFSFIDSVENKNLELRPGLLSFIKMNEGTVQWKSTSISPQLQMDVEGSLEFDGFLSYVVRVIALSDISLKDINMQIPFNKNASEYMLGLGQKGGKRPASFEWKWDVKNKNQDGAWIGSVNSGLQYTLKDENYSRPLNTNFYLLKPLHLPASWGNENKGGISIREQETLAIANNYSGSRNMKKGDTLYYNFSLLITPFHTINTDFQWENRFYHRYSNVETIKASGATVVNIHHANAINPWINYPFIEYRKMKSFIDSAHNSGLKVKIYNTVREVSNKAYETFPLRSLGHEIYSPGNGGGFSWLQEHVGKDYIAAWFVPAIKDAAIVNSGMSRWHNYYVEGMNWLVKNVGIDGIYLDDVAFDRITMKRIKRALTKDGHPGIIDLHSANQFNKSDGFNNSANLYLEHFPYLNRLWFGEYFDYENNDPEFFLTEVSGIPFGLMGEMLEKGGNPWRGMVYGMTNRFPWSDDADPRNLWKAWDTFGMKGTSMIGYWSENCPVKTSEEKVLATVYQKPGAALVSIASWAPVDTNVSLLVDWKKLNLDPAKVTIKAPAIHNFQEEKSFSASEPIPVKKGQGWLLIIQEKNN